LGSALIAIVSALCWIVIVGLSGEQRLDFSNPAISKKETTASKKSQLFRSQFSCERNRQSTIKFDVDLDMIFIYRLVLRKLGFLESIVFLYHSNQSLYEEFFFSFTDAYQSIDMHCIVVPVKFDGGLSISK
jgi:hypothetical protein